MELTKNELETIKCWALADFNNTVINRSDNDGLHMTRCFVNATMKVLQDKKIKLEFELLEKQ